MSSTDTTPPVLTGLSLPDIDISDGATTVTISATASDEGTGVDRVVLYMSGSFRSGGFLASPLALMDTFDSFADGISIREYQVDADSAAGSYTISGATVWDKAGNSTDYSAAQLNALGIDTSFVVTSNVAPDTAPPVLTGLSLPDIDISDGATTVTISATASDEGTGVDRVVLYMSGSFRSGGFLASPLALMDTFDSFADGISIREYQVDADSAAGSYTISGATVWDKAGNSTDYSAAQLNALGIDTSFVVHDDGLGTTSGDDLVTLTSVSSGGPVTVIDGLTGTDTLDFSGIFAGSYALEFRSYDGDADFAGKFWVQVANYNVVNFEILVGSELGRNRFFLPSYDLPITLHGGQYDDTFFSSHDHRDILYGHAGNDSFSLNGGDTAYGGPGDDHFAYNWDGAIADGGTGIDQLNAGFGSIVDLASGSYQGPIGSVMQLVSIENVLVYAWRGYATSVEGNDDANLLHVDQLFDDGSVGVFFDGREGNDTLRGSAAADDLLGGPGNDVLDGRGGNDMMTGGFGDDTYFVDSAGDVVNELAGQGNDTMAVAFSYTLADGSPIENLATIDAAVTTAINLTGNAGINSLTGNAGSNVLDGGLGNDTMVGGAGDDIYFIDSVGDQVVEDGAAGYDTVFASVSYTLGANVERVVAYDAASTAGLSFTGNALNNELSGNAGANLIDGGAGADFMSGQGGDDIYFVDNAGDYVLETAGNGFDTVFASVSYTLTPHVERVFALDPAGTAALNFTGNDLDNELGGTAGANILDGGAGADLMVGGDGDDIYFVDNVGDVVSDSPSGGYDTVFASINFVLETRIERVVALDPNATTALQFTGNASANEISGNAGGNLIDGGGGSDILLGLGGADAFAFTSALGGDTIAQLPDFEVGIDRFYLDDAVFTGLAAGALSAGAFHIGSAAADADDRIIYDAETGALYFDADGNGAGLAVQFANLHEGLPLNATDFQVI